MENETKPEEHPVDTHFDVIVGLVNRELYTLHEKMDAREAIRKALRMTMGGAARIGLLTRVVLLDTKRRVAFDWNVNEGVVFPPNLDTALNEAQQAMLKAIVIVSGERPH